MAHGGSVSPRDQVGGCLAAARPQRAKSSWPQRQSPAISAISSPERAQNYRERGSRSDVSTQSGQSESAGLDQARRVWFKPVCSGPRTCRRPPGAAWLPVENMWRLIPPLGGLMGARATFGEGGRRPRRLRPQIFDQQRRRAVRIVPVVTVAMLVAVPVALVVGMPVFGVRRLPVRGSAFFVVAVVAEEEMVVVQASLTVAVHMVPWVQELRTQTEHRQRGKAPGEYRATQDSWRARGSGRLGRHGRVCWRLARLARRPTWLRRHGATANLIPKLCPRAGVVSISGGNPIYCAALLR